MRRENVNACLETVIARSEATKQSIAARKNGLVRRFAPLRKRFAFVAGNDDKHQFAIPRRDAPELCIWLSPSRSQRAQGRPGARCTRGLVCKLCVENAHEHTGSAETLRPSLRNGLTAYAALSSVTNSLLSPSSAD